MIRLDEIKAVLEKLKLQTLSRWN